MTGSVLGARWATPDGRALAEDAVAHLAGRRRRLPRGVGTHEGRHDLRGLALPRGGDLERVRWEGLDLQGARLGHLRLARSRLEGCRLDHADCADWRLWDTRVSDCSFAGADLRDAALGTWHDRRRNEWRRVRFDRADLRGPLLLGCLLEDCSFSHTRLDGAQVQQAEVRDCSSFAGPIRHVLLDGRELPDRPRPAPYIRVDFGAASFEDVDVTGCHVEDVTLPPGSRLLPRYPVLARYVLAALDGDDSLEARMLRGELEMVLRLPGDDDSVSVLTRSDYVGSGGDALADLVERLFAEAEAATGR